MNEFMPLAAPGGRRVSHLFIALACAVVFFGVVGINAVPALRSVQSYLWPKALGVVTSASAGEVGGGLLGTVGAPRMACQFRVGGKNYQGGRICYGGALLPMSVFEGSLAESASSLSVGDKVPLYYHPKDPTIHVINRGVRLSLGIELVVAVLFFLYGLNRWSHYLYDDSTDGQPAALSSRPIDPQVLPFFNAYAEKIRDSNSAFHVFPNLPLRRLTNAIERYAPGFSPQRETPLVLVDDTVSGSARKGCLMTDQSLYGSEIDPERRVSLKELDDIRVIPESGWSVIGLRTQRLQTLTIPSVESVDLFVEMLRKISFDLCGISEEEDEEDTLYIQDGDPDPETAGIVNAAKSSLTDDRTWFLDDIPKTLLENAARSLSGDSEYIGLPLLLIDTTPERDATEGLLVSDLAVFGKDDEGTPVCEEISFLSDIQAARGVLCSHLDLNGTRMRLNGYSKKNTRIIADILSELSVLQKSRGRWQE